MRHAYIRLLADPKREGSIGSILGLSSFGGANLPVDIPRYALAVVARADAVDARYVPRTACTARDREVPGRKWMDVAGLMGARGG